LSGHGIYSRPDSIVIALKAGYTIGWFSSPSLTWAHKLALLAKESDVNTGMVVEKGL
jgi:hypothetical protein